MAHRSPIVFVALALALGSAMPVAAQDVQADDLLLIEVLSATIPAHRAGGTASWDAAPTDQANPLCDAATVAAGAWARSQQVAVSSARLCSFLTTQAPAQADPSDPDVFVELDLGAGSSKVSTEGALDTLAPEWRFGLFVRARDLPASVIAAVIDADPGQRRDPIGSVMLRRDDLVTASRDGSVIEGTTPEGLRLRVRVSAAAATPYGQPQTWGFDVPAADQAVLAPLPNGVVVPIGARIRVEASGRVYLGDPNRYPSTDAVGSPDPTARAYALEELRNANINFGALIWAMGSELASRQTVATGRCREFTATRSGVPVFTINDRSRESNTGTLSVRMTIAPPSSEDSMGAQIDRPCEVADPNATNAAPLPSATWDVVEVVVSRRKATGEAWDGDGSDPDLFAVVTVGQQPPVTTPTAQDRVQVAFEVPPVNAGAGTVAVEVWDRDVFSNDLVGRVVLDVAGGQTTAALDGGGGVRLVSRSSP